MFIIDFFIYASGSAYSATASCVPHAFGLQRCLLTIIPQIILLAHRRLLFYNTLLSYVLRIVVRHHSMASYVNNLAEFQLCDRVQIGKSCTMGCFDGLEGGKLRLNSQIDIRHGGVMDLHVSQCALRPYDSFLKCLFFLLSTKNPLIACYSVVTHW
jgi:hypothetical protein